MKIGFVGLGQMGMGMALSLHRAGHDCCGFDLNPKAVQSAQEAGLKTAQSLMELCKGQEAIITMLPAGQQVQAVYEGKDGLLAHAAKDCILIDSSTIEVDMAQSIQAKAAALGFDMLDAPVSGGIAAAAQASLTFMVGATDTAFERAKPILEAMGKAVIHAGPSGMGQAAKVCNNMLLGISMIGTCEAFGLAQNLGLDPQVFFDIASKASGQNWSMTSYCPVPGPVPQSPANRDYQAGFAVDLMLKDLKLSQQAAQALGTPTPLGAHARDLYAALSAQGYGPKDFSIIMTALKNLI